MPPLRGSIFKKSQIIFWLRRIQTAISIANFVNEQSHCPAETSFV